MEELYGVDDENELSYLEEDESRDDVDMEENVAETVTVGRVYKKKNLTSNRLLYSISSALDENNYDEILHPQGQPKAYTAFFTPAKSGKLREEISWVDRPPQTIGRQRRCDVINGKPEIVNSRIVKVADTERLSCLLPRK